MKYNQPYGVSDPNAPYINGDPSIGQAGSIPPAASIEYPQREIVNFISDSGLTPDNSDLHQLSKSVQIGTVMYGIDVGPVNAVAITLTPALAAYVDGQVFRVKIANSNTGPATFNAGPGPLNIVRRGGAVLQAGDLPAGYMTFLSYNATHNNVELYGASFAPATFVPILGANTAPIPSMSIRQACSVRRRSSTALASARRSSLDQTIFTPFKHPTATRFKFKTSPCRPARVRGRRAVSRPLQTRKSTH